MQYLADHERELLYGITNRLGSRYYFGSGLRAFFFFLMMSVWLLRLRITREISSISRKYGFSVAFNRCASFSRILAYLVCFDG